jgi:hypothetical protein
MDAGATGNSSPEKEAPPGANQGAKDLRDVNDDDISPADSVKRNGGWFAIWRSPEMFDMVVNHPKCFLLLTLIAARARYSGSSSLNGLQIGEARIGDFKKCGLTRKEYRTALDKLEAWHFVATKRANKGTIAKLLDNPIYEYEFNPKGQQNGHQRASKGPAEGHQGATNNKETRKQGEQGNKERVVFSLAEAVDHFQPLFPDIPCKRSLSRLVKEKGKGFLTESYIGNVWLPREDERWPAKEPIKDSRKKELEEERYQLGPEAVEAFKALRNASQFGKDGFASTGLEKNYSPTP